MNVEDDHRQEKGRCSSLSCKVWAYVHFVAFFFDEIATGFYVLFLSCISDRVINDGATKPLLQAVFYVEILNIALAIFGVLVFNRWFFRNVTDPYFIEGKFLSAGRFWIVWRLVFGMIVVGGYYGSTLSYDFRFLYALFLFASLAYTFGALTDTFKIVCDV